jgi:hypothetical protein
MLPGGFEPPIFSLQMRCLTNLAIRAENASFHPLPPIKQLGFAFSTLKILLQAKNQLSLRLYLFNYVLDSQSQR